MQASLLEVEHTDRDEGRAMLAGNKQAEHRERERERERDEGRAVQCRLPETSQGQG